VSKRLSRARTIRILLQSLSATALTASQPSCDGSMWIRNGRLPNGVSTTLTMASATASASGSQAAMSSRISSARPAVDQAWRLLRFRPRLVFRLDGEHPYRGLGHHNRQDGGFVEVLHVGGWQRNNGARGFDLHRRSTDFLDSTRGDAHVRQDWLTRLQNCITLEYLDHPLPLRHPGCARR